MKRYLIREIFGPTIEGEGSNAGKAVIFIRFAGCNKWSGRIEDKEKTICKFCDTDFVGGERMTAMEISSRVRSLDKGLVRDIVISGGEPTLQIDYELLRELKVYNYRIQLETNGSRKLGLELIQMIDKICMSPKQSREETRLEWCHDLKILYPPINPLITPECFLDYVSVNKYLQPIDDQNKDINLQRAIQYIYQNPEWRLSVQLHKVIGVQ